GDRTRTLGVSRRANWLERPKSSAGLGALRHWWSNPCDRQSLSISSFWKVRPGHAQSNPTSQGINLGGLKLARGRHLWALVADCLDEQALFWFSRHHRLARFSSFENRIQRVQTKSALLLRSTVTLLAFFHQEWPNLLLEEAGLGRIDLADGRHL